MEFENEKINEEKAAEQQHTTDHENSGYQGYRPGRSPRPRIHQQTRPYNQGSFNRNQEEGGFRPEGFGAGLQNAASQPREYNQQRGGYLVSSMVSLVRAVISNVVVTASPVRVAISLVSSMVSPVSSMVSLVRVVISSVAVTASPVRVVMVSSVAVIASILLAMIPMQNIA